MMRRPLTTLTLVASCGLLCIGTAQALSMQSAHDTAERTWRVTLSPAPDDLALAQLSFHGANGKRLSGHSLQVAASAVFGDDYLAAATPRFATRGGPRALVLLVNRPSPLLDPASVVVRVSASRTLGGASLSRLDDPFARPATDPKPTLCDLHQGSSTLSGSQLSALGSRGSPLAGFDTAGAVAQAYDVACELPYSASFKAAVEQSATPSQPAPPQPTPPAPLVSPEPMPPAPITPVPGPPSCTPCDPPPGYACPLAVQPGVCVASLAGGSGRTHADAH